MLSTAYRQSSRREPAQLAIDAENRYYGRRNLLRLDAEALRDRALATTVTLDRTQFGPPIGVKEDDSGQVIVASDVRRRSLYLLQRRTQPIALLQAFDAPVMTTNCEARLSSTVATQSLMLMNGEFWLSQATALADRAQRESVKVVPTDLAAGLSQPQESSPGVNGACAHCTEQSGAEVASVISAWQLAYLRLPTEEELASACEFLNRQCEYLRQSPQHLASGRSPETQALANLCHALLSSNEFLYVD